MGAPLGLSIGAVLKPISDENVRAERLLDAQDKAAQLFDEIERREMIRPGVGEQELSDEIRDLAAQLLGVTGHWHRRIVRAGGNTLQPFREHPPDRVVAAGDIVFLELGPIFEAGRATGIGGSCAPGRTPCSLFGSPRRTGWSPPATSCSWTWVRSSRSGRPT